MNKDQKHINVRKEIEKAAKKEKESFKQRDRRVQTNSNYSYSSNRILPNIKSI